MRRPLRNVMSRVDRLAGRLSGGAPSGRSAEEIVLCEYLLRLASDDELAQAEAILSARGPAVQASGLSREDEYRAAGLSSSGFGCTEPADLRRQLETYEAAAGGPARFAARFGEAPDWNWRDLTLLQVLQAA